MTGRDEAGAVLTVDLAALRANYRLLRDKVAPARGAAVVKADAYGLGAAQVAAALAREGCETFFVAHLSEGRALKPVLSAASEIHILNGIPPGAEPICAQNGLVPVINSLEQLAAWRNEAMRLGRGLPAALQVDSGMARLGLAAPEVEALAADADALDGIEVRLVMSHLARADEAAEPASAAQLAQFERLRRLLPAAPTSFANSSGIFLGEPYRFDRGRRGAALSGIRPTPGRPNPMRPVVGLDAKVIQTRRLEAGDGVGYGHIFTAPRAMDASTISLGYADGWHRHARSAAWFGGSRLPFIGRVSMDSIILDISALPPGTLEAGDLVELIGPHQSVDDVAAHAHTIGYEILTSLGRRFHRIYLDDDASKENAA